MRRKKRKVFPKRRFCRFRKKGGIGVFVDAQNIRLPDLEDVLHKIRGKGNVKEVAIFGTWSEKGLSEWTSSLSQDGVRFVECAKLTKAGKNAADIEMVIQMMDALDEGSPIETYVIVSSDSDFVPISRRLQKAGKSVVVFGDGKIVAPALIEAASSFHELKTEKGPLKLASGMVPEAQNLQQKRIQSVASSDSNKEAILRCFHAARGNNKRTNLSAISTQMSQAGLGHLWVSKNDGGAGIRPLIKGLGIFEFISPSSTHFYLKQTLEDLQKELEEELAAFSKRTTRVEIPQPVLPRNSQSLNRQRSHENLAIIRSIALELANPEGWLKIGQLQFRLQKRKMGKLISPQKGGIKGLIQKIEFLSLSKSRPNQCRLEISGKNLPASGSPEESHPIEKKIKADAADLAQKQILDSELIGGENAPGKKSLGEGEPIPDSVKEAILKIYLGPPQPKKSMGLCALGTELTNAGLRHLWVSKNDGGNGLRPLINRLGIFKFLSAKSTHFHLKTQQVISDDYVGDSSDEGLAQTTNERRLLRFLVTEISIQAIGLAQEWIPISLIQSKFKELCLKIGEPPRTSLRGFMNEFKSFELKSTGGVRKVRLTAEAERVELL